MSEQIAKWIAWNLSKYIYFVTSKKYWKQKEFAEQQIFHFGDCIIDLIHYNR